jgi:hypothetical protein
MSSRAVISTPQISQPTASDQKQDQATSSTSTSTSSTTANTTNKLDFIGPSNAVKSLFSVPYATDKPINVAVHNIDGTLLLDTINDEDVAKLTAPKVVQRRASRRRPRPVSFDLKQQQQHSLPQQQQQQQEDALAIVTTMLGGASIGATGSTSENTSVTGSGVATTNGDDQPATTQHDGDANVENQQFKLLQLLPGDSVMDLTQRLPPPEQYNCATIPLPSPPREYLQWKFHDLQLLVGSDALIYNNTTNGNDTTNTTKHAVRLADAHELQSILANHEESVRQGHFVPDHQMARLQQRGKPSYAQTVVLQQEGAGSQKTVVSPDKKSAMTTTTTTSASFAAPDLDQVQLQTCIVPSSTTPLGGLLSEQVQQQQPSSLSSIPVCTVMDAYLDNIMANVPQLALCLREKGFIQSVKLLETKDIPSSLMVRSTLETTDSFSISKVDTTSAGEPLFSPQIMEMNASTLLRFLKANCKRDNSTYLLRREAGHTDIQLYDITSISAHRQRKWIWWLATMSYRFALRLGHLSAMESCAERRRAFRCRQRSLLENSLQLLGDLADMDGSAHETLCASVSENLADTFLCSANDAPTNGADDDLLNGADRPATISSPPYAHVTADALGKAQDHLKLGVKTLWPLVERAKKKSEEAKLRKQNKRRMNSSKKVKVSDESSSSSSEEDATAEEEEETPSLELQSLSLQLFSLHHKLINVSLRLAEHHLSIYWSSSAMQALRTAARTITDAIELLRLCERSPNDEQHLQLSLRYQFTWLWEHCGHFARSFAADELWRERGHTCGEDIISVLRDVENAVSVETDGYNPNDWFNFVLSDAPITDDTGGLISLNEVGSIVEKDCATTISEVQKAVQILDRQKLIQRDQRRVLVAACVSYSRAIGIFEEILRIEDEKDTDQEGKIASHESRTNEFLSLLRQRLGDSCNEIGKILLRELRQLMTSSNETSVAEIILCSAQFWFDEGLQAFEACRDLRNLALLRCNLCQCWKIRANASFATTEEVNEGSTHAEECLQNAAEHLQEAHEALGERDVDPMTWDMVSQELAATFLVLGVRRRQTALGGGTTPVLAQALRLSPGQERGIVEPMEQALKIYIESGNLHQAAAVSYQFALFYSRVWTCQRDEMKTREKLSAAFKHYAAAHAYFGRAPPGNESTFCLLCLDLSNLYAAVSGKECLSKALARCLDTVECFSQTSVDAARERGEATDWFPKMTTVASSVEDRIFKLLVSLVKEEKDGAAASTRYKDLYRAALTAKMKVQQSIKANDDDDIAAKLAASHELLAAIKASHQH